jgi:hypothetical protein
VWPIFIHSILDCSRLQWQRLVCCVVMCCVVLCCYGSSWPQGSNMPNALVQKAGLSKRRKCQLTQEKGKVRTCLHRWIVTVLHPKESFQIFYYEVICKNTETEDRSRSEQRKILFVHLFLFPSWLNMYVLLPNATTQLNTVYHMHSITSLVILVCMTIACSSHSDLRSVHQTQHHSSNPISIR